jgi:calpain
VPGQTEAELPNGLIAGHAYSITDVRTVSTTMFSDLDIVFNSLQVLPKCSCTNGCWSQIEVQTSKVKGKMQMVRVRNPWGNECEWKGAWSDKWVELDIDLLIAS